MRLTKYAFIAYLLLIVFTITAYCVSRLTTPPRDPDTLFTTYASSIRSLDPPQIYDVSTADISGHVYECLYNFRYGGKPDDIFPQIAAEMPTISSDGITYTIPLRRGIHFYDPRHEIWPEGRGPELTARDVVFSWKRFANFHLAAGAYSSFLEGVLVGLDDFRKYTETSDPKQIDFSKKVEGLVALDDHTLQLKLVKPNPQFVLYMTAIPLAVVSEDAIQKVSDLTSRPIGTGPYAITEYKNEQYILMEKNPVYRGRPDVDGQMGENLPEADRLPTIKRIRWDYFAESLPAWHLFLQGRYDYMSIPKETFSDVILPGQKLAPKYAAKGINLRVYDDAGLYYIQFNMTDPVVGKNKALRQAMSLAFDRETFIRIYLSGRGRPGTGIIPPDAPTYDPNYVSKWHRLDRTLAKQKLAEAEKFHGGPLPVIRVQMMDSDTESRQYGEFFKTNMAEIGLRVEPQYDTYDRWLEKLDNKDYQMSFAGWAPDYPDEKTYFKLYDARLAKPPGSNTSGYNNPEFQKLFEQSEVLPKSAERDVLYLRMRDILDDDLPSFTTYYPQVYSLSYNWVGNFSPKNQVQGFFQFRTLDTHKRRNALVGIH